MCGSLGAGVVNLTHALCAHLRCDWYVKRRRANLLAVLLALVPVILIAVSYFEDLAETKDPFPSSDFDVGSAGWLISLVAVGSRTCPVIELGSVSVNSS